MKKRNYNIPIFVPHLGCPHECVFCNQKRITGMGTNVNADDVRCIVSEHLATIPPDAEKIEIAFFGGSFTAIPIRQQNELLNAAREFVKNDRVSGIRLSTRPDRIDDAIVKNLSAHYVTAVELGVQSMDDEVLEKSGRGHKSDIVLDAVKKIREYGIDVGLQMMTGLPGDSYEKSIKTAEKIAELRPDTVRIYPTLVIKDTALEKMYISGEYVPPTLDETVELVKNIVLIFEKNDIKIIRIGLQSTSEICENGSVVAGPVHSAFGELVENSIYYDIFCSELTDGCEYDVFVSPGEISKAVGNKKCNLLKLKKEHNIKINIHTDNDLNKREVKFFCC